jgi:hypothetical protein
VLQWLAGINDELLAGLPDARADPGLGLIDTDVK